MLRKKSPEQKWIYQEECEALLSQSILDQNNNFPQMFFPTPTSFYPHNFNRCPTGIVFYFIDEKYFETYLLQGTWHRSWRTVPVPHFSLHLIDFNFRIANLCALAHLWTWRIKFLCARRVKGVQHEIVAIHLTFFHAMLYWK